MKRLLDMRIRAAKKEDHPALAAIFLHARREYFTWTDPESHALEDFAEQTEGEAIHVAENDSGEILGFISVWEAENFIHHLFVSSDHQRKGVGKALLEDLASRRSGPFTLKCVAENGPALAFYSALGWRAVGSGTSPEGHYLYFLFAWHPAWESPIKRRPGHADDLAFLWQLHVLTMQDYAAKTWGWDHVWQEERFRENFDPRSFEILEIGGHAVGTLSVAEEVDHVFLRLIELLPEWQNRGLGSQLVADVVIRACQKKQPARLQVLKVNPARGLYERCGFVVTGETETHLLMEHPAGSPLSPRQAST